MIYLVGFTGAAVFMQVSQAWQDWLIFDIMSIPKSTESVMSSLPKINSHPISMKLTNRQPSQ